MKTTKKGPEKPPRRKVTKTKVDSRTPERETYVKEKKVLRGNVSKTKGEYEDYSYGNDKDGIAWMKQLEPTSGQQFNSEEIAKILSLDSSEIDDRFPVEEISTGLPIMIVPLKTLESLKKARIVRDPYFAFVKNTWAKAILVFCPMARNPQNQISVRVFVDYYGVPEDPATGSGNGCLAGYLVKHRYWGQPSIDIRSEQGYEIDRPSLLYLKANEKDGKINVFVGGQSITIAQGQFV
jgi:trans-2,3-dihydro-3-hydroxyanthranilate isomerase